MQREPSTTGTIPSTDRAARTAENARYAGALDKQSAEKAFPAQKLYSPYAGRNFPTRPYFLFFNVGVEVGQLVFIAAVLAVIGLGRRLPITLPAWAWRVPPYAIGAVATFWLIERLVAIGA